MASPIERLYKAVLQTADADPASSRTALLLCAGRGKIGKEVAEEPFVLVFWSRDPDGTQHFQGDSLNVLVPGINGPTSLAGIRNADDDLARIHPHQQRAIAAPQRQTCRSSPQGDIELMTEKQDLGFKPTPQLEQIGDKRSKQAEERKHQIQ